MVHEASGHLPVSLAPTSLHALQTEPVLAKVLLSLVVQLALQFHLFGSVRRRFQINSSQALIKCQRVVRINGSSLFLWAWTFLRFSCVSLWLTWSCVGNFCIHCVDKPCMTTASLSVMQSRFLIFIEHSAVCRYHITKSFGKPNSVRPIVRISSAWRPRNFRASADFAIRVVLNKLRFPRDLFEMCFAGGCAETAGDTSVKLEDPLVNPSTTC